MDEVNRVVPEIIAKGKVEQPGLGLTVASDQLAREYDLPGVLVLSVQPDSPAAEAGIKPTRRNSLGDIIVAINGQKIKTTKDLFSVLEKFKVGDTVTVQVLRSQGTMDVQVKLEPAG